MVPHGTCGVVQSTGRSSVVSASEGEMSKSELSTGDSNAWVEAAQGLRRKDKYVREVTSSEQ